MVKGVCRFRKAVPAGSFYNCMREVVDLRRWAGAQTLSAGAS